VAKDEFKIVGAMQFTDDNLRQVIEFYIKAIMCGDDSLRIHDRKTIEITVDLRDKFKPGAWFVYNDEAYRVLSTVELMELLRRSISPIADVYVPANVVSRYMRAVEDKSKQDLKERGEDLMLLTMLESGICPACVVAGSVPNPRLLALIDGFRRCSSCRFTVSQDDLVFLAKRAAPLIKAPLTRLAETQKTVN